MNENFSDLISYLNRASEVSGDWEATLRRWAKPPSQTEQEKCDRAVRMIQQAIDNDPKLSRMDITVFPKGSFHNRTNIPSDSDVDVGVLANKSYFNDYPEGVADSDVGFTTSDYTFAQFKEDVCTAIINKFGRSEAQVSDKSIKVRSNSSRVDADVVPHFVHRRYSKDKSYGEGVALRTRTGTTIYNWPEQDYDNGVLKNDRTGKRYKAMVRIVKSLRSQMADEGYKSAEGIQSYLIACLVWNVPDQFLAGDEYANMVRGSLEFLREATANLETVKEWGEVNELKYLFRDAQPWKLTDVHRFIVDAVNYVKGKEE